MHAYDLNERLLAAVHTGTYEETLSALMDGAKATHVSVSCGRTAVGTAALVGDAEILELLLQSCEEPDLEIFSKSNPNSIEIEIDSTPDGMDNLEWEDEFNNDCYDVEDDAIHEEHTSLYFYYAKTFERTGAIINSMDDAYCNAVKREDPHTLDAMLMSPLHYAAACGHLDCARILLEHNACVDAVNSDGYTPLHLAAEYSELTQLLIKHQANPNSKTISTGETALHLAIRNRCSKVANIIITQAHNVSINDTDDIDQTPLICAIIHNLEDVANILLDRGARLNLQDKEGHTALYYAVLQNKLQLATRLLSSGARRITAHYLLHHCVRYNLRQMAELLITHGDSLNVRNNEGITSILLAILGQKADMLDYLLTIAGRLAIDRVENELVIAVQYIDSAQSFMPIARTLFQHAEGLNDLFSVANAAALTTATTNASICYVPYCQTPLARAIMLQKFDIAEFLIKEGVDITQQICCDNVINNLRSAMAPGYADLAKLLVHAGFKYPCNKLPFPTSWKPERQKFEQDMLQLCSQPLQLQSLTRITIRRQLMHLLCTSKLAKIKYRATGQTSCLSRMIAELEIPAVLQTFLTDFDDCPTVMKARM